MPQAALHDAPQAVIVFLPIQCCWLRALLAIALFSAGPAWAHGGLGDGQSIWSGALHLLTSPLSLAALAGLTAALFGCREKMVLPAAALAGLAAGVAAALVPRFSPAFSALVAPALVVLTGLFAVAALKPGNAGIFLLSLLAGLAAGVASGLDTPGWQGVIGVAGSVTLLIGCALAAAHDMLAVRRIGALVPVARRVLGAWVAAIGLLTGALAIHLQRN